MEIWEAKVQEAQDAGKILIVMGDGNIRSESDFLCSWDDTGLYATLKGNTVMKMRLGENQGLEIEWMRKKRIPFKAYYMTSAMAAPGSLPRDPCLVDGSALSWRKSKAPRKSKSKR